MISAIIAYMAAFGLAWAPVVARAFPWTLLLLVLPVVWIAGVARGFAGSVSAGFYALIGLAVWAALSEAFYLGLAAVVLSILAWDAAGLSLWLRKANEIRDRTGIWQSLVLRSCGLALTGAALALGFAQLELSLSFWVLVVLLLAAWATLAALPRVIHPRRSDGQDLNDSRTP